MKDSMFAALSFFQDFWAGPCRIALELNIASRSFSTISFASLSRFFFSFRFLQELIFPLTLLHRAALLLPFRLANNSNSAFLSLL